ncbi:GGDEF domain-containing protein [Acidihalobacter prosperus]|uniref:GGDEF domain-containing protein n=1 Tax=Acidihalobacter prosperus TaxID=160660 RepID=A0A1A6C408_9GAMM|nr:GGDEF domain-containing protein [Acidihalobacter prosperus]
MNLSFAAAAHGPDATQIRADQLSILYSALPIALLATLINAAVLGAVQSPLIPKHIVGGWLGAIVLLTAWRFVGYYRYTRGLTRLSATRGWTIRFLTEVLISGALWGAAAFLLYPPGDPLHQMFLVFVLAGMGAGAVTTLSAMWAAALSYLLPSLLPLIAHLLLEHSTVSLAMACMAMLFLVMMAVAALRARNTLLELLRARHAQVRADADLRLAATAFRSQEGILIADRAGNILRINEAAARLSGFAETALVGRPARELLSPDDAGEAARRSMFEALERSGFWAGECRLVTRDGGRLPISATVATVRDPNGETSHYVGHFQDISAYKQAQANLDFQARHDTLTALPNRRMLSERLARDITRCRRHRHHGAAVFIDIDHFKRVNDALGHRVGDHLLQTIAFRLLENIRGEDIAARFGGDEFVVVLTGLDAQPARAMEQAQQAAEKLRTLFATPFRHHSAPLHLTASFGIALYPQDDHDEDAESVLTRADTALYQVKERGRNALAFYQPGMLDAVRTRLSIENALRNALEENTFELFFQPQVDTTYLRMVGVEALLRWNRPGHGRVMPGEFIPVAEDSGLILPVGDWVMQSACSALARWRGLPIGAPDFALSINVSPRQFFQADFVSRVLGCLEAHDLNGRCLELELTESVLLDDIGETRAKMRQLAEHGIRFALDDFGTGYSSLRYLQQLPITTLKIDQSFVRELREDDGDGNTAIIRSILSVARHLGLKVVAEGVETRMQAEMLDALGCRVHQGYRYSRPIGESEILSWLGGRTPASAADH